MVGRITSFFSSFLISSSLLSPFLAPAIQPPIHSTLRLSLLYAVFFGRKEALGTVTAVVFSHSRPLLQAWGPPGFGAVTGRSYPTPEAGGGGREDQPHVQGAVAVPAQEGLEELSHVEGQEGWR